MAKGLLPLPPSLNRKERDLMTVMIDNQNGIQLNCIQPAPMETIRTAMTQEPFFQWVCENPELLNDGLIKGLIANLIPLKDSGKQFLKELQSLTPMHNQKLGMIDINQSLQGNVAVVGYDVLSQLGYTGENRLGNPASATLKRLSDLKFRNRGLSINTKGNLQLNANVFARFVLKRIQLVCHSTEGMFVYKNTGQYVGMDEELLKKICRNILHEAKEDIWCRKWESEYFEAVKRSCPYVERMNHNADFINLKNGMLNINTMKLENHDPKFLSTIQIDINYDPSASCPNFISFLEDIFEGDQERVELIQEILGYCFLQDVKIQQAFFFLGTGSNGKSVLAEVMRHLYGPMNVANVPLSQINGRFGMQNLPGKLVNISSENEFDRKFNTQNFKLLTGGDSVNVEQKHKDSFNIKLFTKIIILLNRMMDSEDYSPGYYRRLLIIPFNKVYKELKAGEIPQEGVSYMDKELTERLLNELDGILTFAMQGLKRFTQNKYNLRYSKVCQRALENYGKKQNPTNEFFQDMIDHSPQFSVKRSDIKKSFIEWAGNNGYEEFTNIGATKFWELFHKVLTEKGVEIGYKKVKGHIYVTGIQLCSTVEESTGYVGPC